MWQERNGTFSAPAAYLKRSVDQHRMQGFIILTRYGYADTGWITCQGNKYFLRASGALHQGGLIVDQRKDLPFQVRIWPSDHRLGDVERENRYYFRETNNNGAMI